MSGFKPPKRELPALGTGQAPQFDERKVQQFLGGAQVRAQRAEIPEPARIPAPLPRTEPIVRGDKIVVPDARFKAEAEVQSEQFVLRFTKSERAALDRAFKGSEYRYLQQYVRSLILPHLDMEQGSEGEK